MVNDDEEERGERVRFWLTVDTRGVFSHGQFPSCRWLARRWKREKSGVSLFNWKTRLPHNRRSWLVYCCFLWRGCRLRSHHSLSLSSSATTDKSSRFSRFGPTVIFGPPCQSHSTQSFRTSCNLLTLKFFYRSNCHVHENSRNREKNWIVCP